MGSVEHARRGARVQDRRMAALTGVSLVAVTLTQLKASVDLLPDGSWSSATQHERSSHATWRASLQLHVSPPADSAVSRAQHYSGARRQSVRRTELTS